MDGVPEVDRRLATELVMGVLRARGDLDYWVENLSRKPLDYFDSEVVTILRMGVYQIRYLAKIPKSAAVNESVELVKLARKGSAAGLVNAVLRKCGAPSRSEGDSTEPTLRSLPAWLRERWARHFGREGMGSLAAVCLRAPPTVLRISHAGQRDEFQQELARAGLVTRPGRFSPLAIILQSGNVRSLDSKLKARFVIQDQASQLVAEFVAPRPGERVLDVCAAPGIKTGQLACAMATGKLVACDLSARRLKTLRKLLPRTLPRGLELFQVRLDARRPLPFGCEFEKILVDVPCSGTGTLARNPEIKWRLRPEDLPRLAEAQSQILRSALETLASGGRLVYATCSLEPEENEQVVEKVLSEAKRFRLETAKELSGEFPNLGALFDSRGHFRTRPDLHSLDGFYAAVITRDG